MKHPRTTLIAAAVAVTLGYGISRWPQMTNWGASGQEAREPLPGDEIVGQAKYRTTHAVTIEAPVGNVWPWLVQIGQGRGGMYSYDWLENLFGLHMHTADRIIPELQALTVGDLIRLVPEGTQPPLRFVVARLEPPHLLVLGPETTREKALEAGVPYPCWTFRLSPVGARSTRLIVRFQSDFKPTLAGWLTYRYALEPVHFMMERKMLLGIKARAEQAVRNGHLTGLSRERRLQ